jgi:hypothetical protein
MGRGESNFERASRKTGIPVIQLKQLMQTSENTMNESIETALHILTENHKGYWKLTYESPRGEFTYLVNAVNRKTAIAKLEKLRPELRLMELCGATFGSKEINEDELTDEIVID